MLERMKNNSGFTLIEIMAVLVILGILGSVGIKKLVIAADTAEYRAIQQGMVALNAEEKFMWVQAIFGPGYVGDLALFDSVNKDLGYDYTWNAGPNQDGGTLAFRQSSAPLTRTRSTITQWARWNL